MKKILKKSLSVILAITMVFSSMYIGLDELDFNDRLAIEAEAASTSDLIFELDADETAYWVLGCNENATGDIVIPETYNGLPVVGIGPEGFFENLGITSISVPKTVKEIGLGAFIYCGKLASINVDEENPVYSSENGVLYNKDKTELICVPYAYNERVFEIPETVTKIKTYAVYLCEKIDVIIVPDSVKSIEEAGLLSYNVELLVLGKGIEELSESAVIFGGSVFIPEEITDLLAGGGISPAPEFGSINFYYSGTEENFYKSAGEDVKEFVESILEEGLGRVFYEVSPEFHQTDEYYYIENNNEIMVCAYWGD